MQHEQKVEVVAQAIQRAFAGRSTKPKPRDWGDLPEQVRVEFRREARAAIEAYQAIDA